MKPLDSNGGAIEHSSIDEPALAAPTAPGSPGEGELGEEAPRARSEIVPAPQNGTFVAGSSLSRVSQVVPAGTAEGEQVPFEDGAPVELSDNALDGAGSADAGSGDGSIEARIVAAQMVRAGSAEGEGGELAARAPGATSAPSRGSVSDVAPRHPFPDGPPYPHAVALRAALKPQLGATLYGPGFGGEEDEEETTVDAGAALTDEEQDALMRRIHSAMAETRPGGTPPPERTAPREPPAQVRDARSMFRQTMLLGLPQVKPSLEASGAPVVAAPSPPPAAPSSPAASSPAGAPEPAAVLASVVRVVGPPTQPPPRRSRRSGAAPAADASEPDHEAFVLSQPVLSADPARRPSRAPMSDVPTPRITRDSISRSSIPGVILPPPPQPQDFEPSPPAMTLRPSLSPSISSTSMSSPASLPLRASIDAPMSRTRPPTSRALNGASTASSLAELPVADPFEGFVAPQPSVAQRWLVVVVVALAVVGLCSLAAIALGLLGKTGW